MPSPILDTFPLGFPWQTADPFLFCAHHDDHYPAGNDRFGPATGLAGRNIGQDFEGIDGWRMYHGDVVPGFPSHPHRGFETVTIARRGLIDHSDSLGAAARFGRGDVQWITTGSGIVHSEMFPLLKQDEPNPVELFQIWLNLPSKEKMVPAHFSMLWAHQIPELSFRDEAGRATSVTLVAGALNGQRPPPPPPHSWAAKTDSEVAIWCLRLEPGAQWTLPAASSDDLSRALYFYRGDSVRVADKLLDSPQGSLLSSDRDVALTAVEGDVELLLLQGRPIGESVAHYGPFVMNTRQELQQAFDDYRRTQYGGWPWPSDGPVHERRPRFARHADGRVEEMDD